MFTASRKLSNFRFFTQNYVGSNSSSVCHGSLSHVCSISLSRSSTWALLQKLKKNNLVLLGSPGSGKTTVGRILGSRLGMPVLDVDNDWLEPQWQQSVSEKLSQCGEEGFLEAEAQTTALLDVSDHVVSLTGSNPMKKDVTQALRRNGLLVFLDVDGKVIAQRLERMKVTRIVGYRDNMSMLQLLQARQQFYEDCYDVRVLCGSSDTPEVVANRVESALQTAGADEYVSTRLEAVCSRGFLQSVLTGLAPDGGLLVPLRRPLPMQLSQWERLVGLSYTDKSLRLLEPWLCHPGGGLSPQQLRDALQRAYTSQQPFPVVSVGDSHVLELFHGPSGSFKDSALQLMPQLYQGALHRLKHSCRHLILVATSGDTGSAVIEGFSAFTDPAQVHVLVLYPERGVSQVQKALMTSSRAPNVSVLGVDADFDFCQSAIKSIYVDNEKKELLRKEFNTVLGSANSVNWGRLVPQVAHHCSGYLSLVEQGVISLGDQVDLCVPTGNFGNILSAFYAKELGVPFARLICASNDNHVLTQFFNQGSYDLRSRNLHVTLSPAIDILRSSNLERLLYHVCGPQRVRDCYSLLQKEKHFFLTSEELQGVRDAGFVAGWCDEDTCVSSIRHVLRETDYLLDPHSAVAHSVGSRLRSHLPLLIAATAHPDKFAPELQHCLQRGTSSNLLAACQKLPGSRPSAHSFVRSKLRQATSVKVLSADVEAVFGAVCEKLA